MNYIEAQGEGGEMSTHLKRWSTKHLIELKEAVKANIVILQNEIPSDDFGKFVVDTLLKERKATLTEVDTILAERPTPRSQKV